MRAGMGQGQESSFAILGFAATGKSVSDSIS